MKVKFLCLFLMMAIATLSVQAQSQYGTTPVSQSDAYYQQWLAEYEATGTQINEISDVYQQEVDKRGYPKKKTVKKKMALIEHYIELLQIQLTDPRLGKDLDTGKVERKISEWQSQLEALKLLLKKI